MSPRCLHPVEWRELNEPRGDWPAQCWRPAGHPPGSHRSRHAVLRARARARERKRERHAGQSAGK
jgi:hypothetical protein